ncbi:MAG: hypothetical protein J0G30_05295 [Actinomycetales bacterium]|nr:hypothetical protein [Actinomycetales bacterium]
MRIHRLATVAIVTTLALGGIAGCAATPSGPSAPAASSSAGTATDGTVLPVDANPITNASTAPGLSVTYAAVEDNVDPATGGALNDQLELTIRNDSASAATGLEVFYTMTDATTGQSESYYQDLGGLTIDAGTETTIYFDNGTGTGHYPENRFSLYRSSTNQVDFTIEVSATDLAPAVATATKGVGTGEVAD